MPDTLVRTADGRLVVLSVDRWCHIVDGHPELAKHRDLVLSTVEDPFAATTGRSPDETCPEPVEVGESQLRRAIHAA